ncbi:hypothetical protein NFI96_030736 [Prochilodus magdalenae]|nr:hypothetical protein NFI96_030736 [Prochilodus magdalenae]
MVRSNGVTQPNRSRTPPPDLLFVPVAFRDRLITWAPTSLTSGLPGETRTYRLLSGKCWWDSMTADIHCFVSSCTVCSVCKTPRSLPAGKLMPLSVPSRPWSHIAVDFVTDLPNSQGHTTILTVVDCFSRGERFIPFTSLPTAFQTAKAVFHHVFRLFGIPEAIVSDQGTQFTSQVWSAFMERLGISVCLTSGYHPQSNGQCERVNQELSKFLRVYCHDNQTDWLTYLPWAEIAQNSRISSTTAMTPFQCILGYQHPLMPWTASQSSVPSVEHWMRRSEEVWEQTRVATCPGFPWIVLLSTALAAPTGRTRLLDFYEDPDESSEAIFNQIVSITENNGLSIKQISAYGADNASVNYGRHNSVFQKLRGVNPHIVKGNCKCHIINNSVKTANRVFSSSGCDVEAFVLKVYSEFSCSAKKVETLKEFCEFTSTKYREILRHVPTRWLSLLPAIQRILECWPALKSYFVSLGKDDCPSIVWTFVGGAADTDVDHTVAECILAFMHNVMQEFDSSIRKLESDSATVIDVYSVMNRLRNQLIARRTDRFYGSKARQIMKDLSPQQQDHFRSLVDRFFEKAVLYLEDKFDFKDQLLAHTGCLSLEGQSLQWSELALLLDKLALDVDEDKLYGDVITLNEVFDTIPKDLTLDRKWAYFFSKATESTELLKVVAFVFSIPVSNAYTERVFSHMENVWSDKRNRLSVAMVKSELQVRLNFKLSCAEFKSFIEKQPTLIAAAKGNAKYKWKISRTCISTINSTVVGQKQVATLEQTHQRIESVLHRHKRIADRRRTEAPSYAPGDRVWLSTRDFRFLEGSKKLTPMYIGPFRVLKKINDVTYRLDLPSQYRICPSFHVSLLKPVVPVPLDEVLPMATPPSLVTVEGEPVYAVRRLLDSRGRGGTLPYLVDWGVVLEPVCR